MTISRLKSQSKSHTGTALARLDERVSRSEVGSGFLERQNFADACASLWIDGELVHLEDLFLHDTSHDIRTPTHELTIARDVLRTRRRIAAQPPGWALSPDGLRSLRGQAWPAPSVGEDGGVQREAQRLAIGIGMARADQTGQRGRHGGGIERGLAIEADRQHAAIAGGGDFGVCSQGEGQAAIAVLKAARNRVGMRGRRRAQERRKAQMDGRKPRHDESPWPYPDGVALTSGKPTNSLV